MAGATRLRHARWHGVSTLRLGAVSDMAPKGLRGASRCVNDAEMNLMLWAKRRQNTEKAHEKPPPFWFFTMSVLRNSRCRLAANLKLLFFNSVLTSA